MEIISCCTGRAWRARLRVGDDRGRRLVEAVRSDVDFVTGTWTQDPLGGGVFEGHREYATGGDPLVAVSISLAGSVAVVDGTLGNRSMTLTNATDLSPRDGRWKCGDHLRLATTEETVELGLRWLLGWGHLGCMEPDEVAFWGRTTTAVAFIVDAHKGWLAADAPLPEGLGESAFVAYCGLQDLFSVGEVVARIAAHSTDAFVGGGMFSVDRQSTRVLVAVAHVEP